jgi:UDP-N-acetylglucosamine diphosphorylase/glucosamine-1-phosphate N-acetyltransferase
MRICIYEDSAASRLEPIALTRPAFALWCGAARLFERLVRQFHAADVGFWMRPELGPMWRLEHPVSPVNDNAWAAASPTVWINGRWLPDAEAAIDAATPHVGIVNRQIAYVVFFSVESPGGEDLDTWLDDWRSRLPERQVGGAMVDYLWDAVDRNAEMLTCDSPRFRAEHGIRPLSPHVAVTGPLEQFIVAEDANIEPFVFVDTRGGPVLIDRGAFVNSFSRLEGPCYVGRDTWIVGAKLRAGTTIGPGCKIGGEVEASIVQGYANKYHDGFLGHSYVGEWVNLAAATHTSDLRNDYDVIRVNLNGRRIVTGRTKIGAYIGDHAKTGLGALLNTGSTVGPFANVLPTGTLLPQAIPAFCMTQPGEFREITDLRKTFTTAGRVMQRRGKSMTDVHREFYYSLFETTAGRRRQAIREGEVRRLKRSV